MVGKFSSQATDMNGMWLVRTQFVTVGSTSFTGNTLTSTNFVPNPVEGYKPVGIIGYLTTNENENGVTPKDSSGKAYSGNSWLCPVQCWYDPYSNVGRIQVRNYSNTGSTETVNRNGGSYVVTHVAILIMYLKDSGAFIPSATDSVSVSNNVALSYGITVGTIATYGRVCQIHIDQTTTQAIPANAAIGTVPKPIATTYAPNVSGSQTLFIQNSDGVLRTLNAIPSGTTIKCSFNYITA